jgi:hypothetical protein
MANLVEVEKFGWSMIVYEERRATVEGLAGKRGNGTLVRGEGVWKQA